MSDASVSPSPLEVRSPRLPPVGTLTTAAPAPAPAPAVPTAGAVGNLQIARQYSCFPFADGMLTFTDGLRPHSRPQPPRRPALRTWSPRPAARPAAATSALPGPRTKRPILAKSLVCLLVPRAATAFAGLAYLGENQYTESYRGRCIVACPRALFDCDCSRIGAGVAASSSLSVVALRKLYSRHIRISPTGLCYAFTPAAYPRILPPETPPHA